MIFQPALLEEKTRALVPVLERAGLPFALLFGSAGRRQAFHDLDVGIVAELDLKRLLELGADLEKAAGLPVDLVDLERAPTALQFEASKGIPLILQDPERLAAWKERVWNSYFAEAQFLHDYAREMLQARAQNQ
jgi:predicted nucleotidyltransferase